MNDIPLMVHDNTMIFIVDEFVDSAFFLIHSSVDRYLGCFHSLAILKRGAGFGDAVFFCK